MPRIIDDETWESVQERMKINERGPGANKAKETYLLSGLIFCGKCNSAMVGNRRYSGRNKDKYLTYECSNRKRNKTCDAKSISCAYAHESVIADLEKKIFSEQAAKKLARKIYDYAQSQSSEIQNDIQKLKKELSEVQSRIDNIVEAVAKGLFHPSFKEKMDHLEQRKETLLRRLHEAEFQAQINSPTIDTIKAYLLKDADIKNKNLDEQKRIIQAYVRKVIVHENELEIYFIVDLNGGGGPYRFISTIPILGYRHSIHRKKGIKKRASRLFNF